MRVQLTVNGVEQVIDDVWELDSLLNMLRENLGLRGTKNACEQGECGSCSVYLDGELVCSCLVAAGQAEGRSVTTVEGLGSDGDLDPVQQAFIDAGGVQCGFCTPGMIMNAISLLLKNPESNRDKIIQGMDRNLCRCGAHVRIIQAIESAAGKMREAKQS